MNAKRAPSEEDDAAGQAAEGPVPEGADAAAPEADGIQGDASDVDAPAGDRTGASASRYLLVPVVLLVLGFAAITGVVLTLSAQNQNRIAAESARQLARNALAIEVETVESWARDYAFWNAAVRNLVQDLDRGWAAENVGAWAYENLGVDATAVLSGDDSPIYVALAGEARWDEPLAPFGDGLRGLARRARAADGPAEEPSRVVSDFVRVNGTPHVAAAAVIAWEDGRDRPVKDGGRPVLIFLRAVGPDMLARIESRFLFDGLTLAERPDGEGRQYLPLETDAGETLGYLAWHKETPGFAWLRELSVPLLAASAVAGILLIVVVNRMRRTTEALESGHARLRRQTAALQRTRDEAERQRGVEIALRREATEANRAKTEFLALMSHELRTPLNAILGFSDIIAKQSLGPDAQDTYREYAGDINESGTHLLSLINDILDLSKIEAGRHELAETRVALADIVTQCQRLLRAKADDKRIAVTATGIDLWLTADPRALKQILINLLSNALKFTEAGGTVRVFAAVDETAVTLGVSDSGIGMDAEAIERALQPFGQVDSRASAAQEGTGLGLNVARALAELHGGALTIESEPGEGTTVTVTLPRERLLSEPAPAGTE